ncbi:MAG: glucan biosynthesis protein [Alphaproteobacteria bacterium]
MSTRPAGAPAQAATDEGAPFEAAAVRRMASERAQKPYQPPPSRLPPALADVDYDRYRTIRFDPQRSLWRGTDSRFELQLFHRGFLYATRVDLFEIVNGRQRRIAYRPDLFDFGQVPLPKQDGLGFAGFRVHGPINRPDYFDEIFVFLGASYFRAVARHQVYGLSARGLAIKTGDPQGEEFPAFVSFWIERPPAGATSIVVHALLDSESAAAAFRFTVRPGETTIFDVEMALYPRVDLARAGIAPLTSMFHFAANDRSGIDDFRPAVHDSDGLAMVTGRGERIWRPLTNPTELQVGAFVDVNPRGFGLMQRKRDFASYKDLEARYERRPSAWIEPLGDWGEGAVHLVEIPTNREINDNIVAFWRPRQPLRAKSEYLFNYRLHWCATVPVATDLATVVETRTGAAWQAKTRLFVIEVAGGRLGTMPPDAPLRAQVSADQGKLQNVVAQPNPETGGWRISFELVPGGAKVVELRGQLMGAEEPVSEVWLYRWTP